MTELAPTSLPHDPRARRGTDRRALPAKPGAKPASKPGLEPTPLAAAPKARRDRRIDVLRGLALATIFIDHIPGTVYLNLTSHNFGFSDAAEMFVFLSGTSAALAYGHLLTWPRVWPGVARMWKRAWTLYLVHLLLTAIALAIVAWMARTGYDPQMIRQDNFEKLGTDLTGVLIGIPTLGHQFGYLNILPLYSALLFIGPALILAVRAAPVLTLLGSTALWAAAGVLGWNIPAYPNPGGWYFDPFSWQLLFTIGLGTGLALKRRRRFVPKDRLLMALATVVLTVSLVWLQWPAFGQIGNAALGRMATEGWPALVRDFDKTILSVPRLVHVLALVYLGSCLGIVQRLCDSPRAELLAVMGRQSLQVFACGTVLAYLARAAIGAEPHSLALSTAVMVAGIGAMILFALAVEKGGRAARVVR